MPVRVYLTGERLDQLQLVNERTMREIGDMAVIDITKRTEAGLDQDGRPFEAYNPDYAAWKTQYTGRGVGRPDLRLSGRMLNDMGVVAVTRTKVVIGFRTAEAAERAMYHVQLGAGRSRRIRDFFGLSQSFLTRAVRAVREGMRR